MLDKVLGTTQRIPVRVPTGSGGFWVLAHGAAARHAREAGFTHFAVPDAQGSWSIFEVVKYGGLRRFVREIPTAEAAEMWLVHRARAG